LIGKTSHLFVTGLWVRNIVWVCLGGHQVDGSALGTNVDVCTGSLSVCVCSVLSYCVTQGYLFVLISFQALKEGQTSWHTDGLSRSLSHTLNVMLLSLCVCVCVCVLFACDCMIQLVWWQTRSKVTGSVWLKGLGGITEREKERTSNNRQMSKGKEEGKERRW